MTTDLPTFRHALWHCLFTGLTLLCLLCPITQGRQATERAGPPRQISYSLTYAQGETGPHFRIELRFTGHESGHTDLVLPSRTGGQTQLYEAIQKLEVLTANVQVAETTEPWVRTLTHPPEQEIRLRYELRQDRPDALQVSRGVGFRPILQPAYFHWLGSAWVYPALDEAEHMDFRLEWNNLPDGWTISNTFGADQRRQRFTTTLRSFGSSVFVGGDFRLRQVIVRNRPVRMALRGTWQFTDDELGALVGKVFGVVRGFWHDDAYPDYLVTLLPMEGLANGMANSGTGLDHSFAMFATPNSVLRDLQYLLAHELFHNWNPRRLGRLPDPPESLYWFSEGVTDYYAWRLLWRGGLITAEEYLAKYNATLRNYHTSPLRHETNARLAREFFSDAELSRLAYWRGNLLAGNWDTLIRAASEGRQSLDDVMRELTGNRHTLTPETIGAIAGRFAKADLAPELRRIHAGSELIMPLPNLFGACAERVMTEIGEYELGIDLEALQARMEIQRVIPGSAAWRAGLRDGQRVLRRPAFSPGDASQEIELTVRESGREKTVRFTPARGPMVSVPQFRWMAGRAAARRVNCEQAY
ncbi:MAG: hypothetical protein ACKV2V_28205 [Blastocatellia bacterium]